MRRYEYLLVIIDISLIYYGWASFDRNPKVSLGVFSLAALIFLAYSYFIKTAPLRRLERLFKATMIASGFSSVRDKAAKLEIVKSLRQFPGFDDIFLSVKDIYRLDSLDIHCWAGRYDSSGYGNNSGYFLLFALEPSQAGYGLRFSHLLDRGETMNMEEEKQLASLPQQMAEVIRHLPCDCHFMNNALLVDFDARHLNKENFRTVTQDIFTLFQE